MSLVICTRPALSFNPDLWDTIISCPLFEYVFEDVSSQNIIDELASYSFLMVTSKAAAMVLEQIQRVYSFPVTLYGVGKGSTQCLRSFPFIQRKHPKEQNANSLFHYICDVHPKKYPLLYLRGETIKHPLKDWLSLKGISCQDRIVYRLHPLPFDFSLLDHQEDFCILFYSKVFYETFMKLCFQHHNTDCLKKGYACFMAPNQDTLKVDFDEHSALWKDVLFFKTAPSFQSWNTKRLQ